MKLLIFAHTPPVHHGQSFMVQRLLDALGHKARTAEATPCSEAGSTPIECHHVDARLSRESREIGEVRLRKFFLLLGYCFQAMYCRLRHGVTNFYYIPAPGRLGLRRDWLVMAMCRPFFKRLIFHWHAAGLGQWLAEEAEPWERWISRRLLMRPALSIVLSESGRGDGVQVQSNRIEVLPNGIPDPCPHFDAELLPRRLARPTIRQMLLAGRTPGGKDLQKAGDAPEVFHVLFLGVCHRSKGLFDAVEAVVLASERLRGTLLRIKLVVAGDFLCDQERGEFDARVRRMDAAQADPLVDYRGFVSGAQKVRLLRESDCLCFPSYYSAESFGLVLLEAMAHGLAVVATRWRSIPEVLPPNHSGLVAPRSPPELATALIAQMGRSYDPRMRDRFLSQYGAARWAEQMKRVLISAEDSSPR